jgi:hypothetical protein
MKDKPEIRDLLDFNYWHDRIGPELTDTMFVVFLQGLHLPFVINTVKRAVYEQDWFTELPITGREWISVALNNVMSMFADNWADCVAHSKWLTGMYFHDLRQFVGERAEQQESEEFGQILKALSEFEYHDNESLNATERFREIEREFATVVASAGDHFPQYKTELEELLNDFLKRSDDSYWKAMSMSFLTSVTGGGKALTGNAPHFTFAAGQDLSLTDTLGDFTRHPLYHVWELVFSTGYSTIAGPLLSRSAFGGAPNGKAMMESVQLGLQQQFNADFPGLAKKFADLKKQESSQVVA